jgi:segregation and condensation protein B
MNVIDYSWDFTKEEFSLDLDFFNEKEQEDKLWQARTGLDYESLCGAVETIIFMNDRPVSLQKIKNQIDSDLPLRVIHESLARLQEEYEQKHHGIRLMEVAEGYQFRTKATYSKLIQEIFKVSSQQLSPTALEVLALIAYKQPISKADVESVRGVDSSHIIRQLMDKRLVRITGRSDEMGRPSLYGTTHEFLEIFNLPNIEALPSEAELMELATASDVASINEIKTIVSKGDKKKFDFDELEELDSLTDSIREISADTLFTKSLKDIDKARSTEDGERKSAFDLLEEYVNSTQICEQNKEAILSELPMNSFEPKSIDTSQDMLFNAPEKEVELENLKDELRELPKAELVLDDNFDDSDIISLENSLDSANEQFEQALAADMKASEPEIQDIDLNETTSEAQMLADELDNAFDNLMGLSEEDSIKHVDEDIIAEHDMNEEKSESLELSKLDPKDLDLDFDFLEDNKSDS